MSSGNQSERSNTLMSVVTTSTRERSVAEPSASISAPDTLAEPAMRQCGISTIES